MGLRYSYIEVIQTYIDLHLPKQKIRMCELGSQELRMNEELEAHMIKLGLEPKLMLSAKDYFLAIGFDHVSVDKNGEFGSLSINLNREIADSSLVGTFNVLTNSGTSEHVSSQYYCFLNCHNLCQDGALMVHIVPQTGFWPNHCNLYYTFEFWQELAAQCNYEIVFEKPISGNTFVILRKTNKSTFISKYKFTQIKKLHTRKS